MYFYPIHAFFSRNLFGKVEQSLFPMCERWKWASREMNSIRQIECSIKVPDQGSNGCIFVASQFYRRRKIRVGYRTCVKIEGRNTRFGRNNFLRWNRFNDGFFYNFSLNCRHSISIHVRPESKFVSRPLWNRSSTWAKIDRLMQSENQD